MANAKISKQSDNHGLNHGARLVVVVAQGFVILHFAPTVEKPDAGFIRQLLHSLEGRLYYLYFR